MSILKTVILFCLLPVYSIAETNTLQSADHSISTYENNRMNIHFTPEEQDYLAGKKEITVCDRASWMPYVGHEGAHTFGIIYDYYKAFGSRIGVPMRFVRASNLDACVHMVLDGRADVVSSIGDTNMYDNLVLSDEYGKDFIALVTGLKTPFISHLENLEDKAVGVIGHYKNMTAYLHKTYPTLRFQKTDTTTEGLDRVANGELYAFIDVYRVAAYSIMREHIGELKINTKIYPLVLKAHVGIRSDNILLKNIFNKAIASLSSEEKIRMINYWMRAEKVFEPDYMLLAVVIVLFLLILFALLYHQYKARKHQKEILAQQAKLAGMGTMINNIAHQWRQPLARINSNITVLNSILDPETGHHKILKAKITSIEDNTQYMSDTIEDFINFFHPDKKQTKFLLQESVKKALSLMGSRSTNADISITAAKDIWINTYEKEYKQVILIIINNAIDNFKLGSTQNPKIDINIKELNGIVTLSIHDNGGGIKEKDKNRIFEPYYTTKFSGEGTGLGLYVAKMLIENSMSGYLRVKNINDGAYFEIEVAQGDINA